MQLHHHHHHPSSSRFVSTQHYKQATQQVHPNSKGHDDDDDDDDERGDDFYGLGVSELDKELFGANETPQDYPTDGSSSSDPTAQTNTTGRKRTRRRRTAPPAHGLRRHGFTRHPNDEEEMIDEEGFHALLTLRVKEQQRQNYTKADVHLREIERMYGVQLLDDTKQWRVARFSHPTRQHPYLLHPYNNSKDAKIKLEQWRKEEHPSSTTITTTTSSEDDDDNTKEEMHFRDTTLLEVPDDGKDNQELHELLQHRWLLRKRLQFRLHHHQQQQQQQATTSSDDAEADASSAKERDRLMVVLQRITKQLQDGGIHLNDADLTYRTDIDGYDVSTVAGDYRFHASDGTTSPVVVVPSANSVMVHKPSQLSPILHLVQVWYQAYMTIQEHTPSSSSFRQQRIRFPNPESAIAVAKASFQQWKALDSLAHDHSVVIHAPTLQWRKTPSAASIFHKQHQASKPYRQHEMPSSVSTMPGGKEMEMGEVKQQQQQQQPVAIGPDDEPTKRTKQIIQGLVQQRQFYKQRTDYGPADAIRDYLWDQYQVVIDDNRREWRMVTSPSSSSSTKNVQGKAKAADRKHPEVSSSASTVRTMRSTTKADQKQRQQQKESTPPNTAPPPVSHVKTYQRASVDTAPMSYQERKEIEDLIRQRNLLRLDRSYGQADAIKEQLWTQHGVKIHDGHFLWTKCGAFTEDELQVRYTRSLSCTEDLTNADLEQIERMVEERRQCKLKRQYDKADGIQTDLEFMFRVFMDDTVRQWRVGPGLFSGAPYKQSMYSKAIHRNNNNNKSSPVGKEEDGRSTSTTTTSTNNNSSTQSIQDLVNERLKLRARLQEEASSLSTPMRTKRGSNNSIDALESKIEELESWLRNGYDVHIHDDLREWSIGGVFYPTYKLRGAKESNKEHDDNDDDDETPPHPRLAELVDLLGQRLHFKKQRQFRTVDELTERLTLEFGVDDIHDRNHTFTLLSESERQSKVTEAKKKKKKQEEEEERRKKKNNNNDTATSDASTATEKVVVYRQSAKSAKIMDWKERREIQNLLAKRWKAMAGGGEEADYDLADEIQTELLNTFDVYINDEDHLWSKQDNFSGMRRDWMKIQD